MRLRLGTFNVWGLPKPFTRHVEQRIETLATRLPDLDLDVLFVQEAWTSWVRERLIRSASEAGFHVSARSADPLSGGLLLFSRLPIREPRFERFHFSGDPERVLDGEYLGGKGFLVVTLDTADGPISLVNTHLIAHYRHDQPRLDSAVRTVQLLQIVRAVRALDGPVVIGGDFNCLRSDPEYAVFAGLTGSVEVADGRSDPATISRSNFYKQHRKSDQRIDYLFVRSTPGTTWSAGPAKLLFAGPIRVGSRDRALSDHFGFASEIEISSPAALEASRVAPDSHALELAEGLLEIGRAGMRRRQQDEIRDAGTWLAAAALAVGCRRLPAVDRRAFLRGTAQGVALLALAPAAGFTSLARLDTTHKLDAFAHADDTLAELKRL